MEPNGILTIDSPIRSLLLSNDEPTNQQNSSIRATMRLVEAELDSQPLDSVEARTRHAALASFLHAHKSLLSPIRRVPFEIWELIIRSAIFNNKDFGDMSSTRQIGGVCRLWNSIAKSLPELSAILPPIRFTQHTATPSFIEALAQRVTKLPSATTISVHFPDPITADGHWQPVVALLSHARRWESLSIAIDPGTILGREAVPFGIILKAINLQQLRICVPGTNIDGYLGECDAFKASPSLREVEIECMAPITMRLPWAQLTSYKERSHGTTIGLQPILDYATGLERLEYRTCHPDVVGVTLIHKITFDRLKSIDIRLYHDSTSIHFSLLDYLLAPSLETLKIRDHMINFLPFLRDFVVESGCGSTLTTLAIDTSKVEPGKLIELLKCMPVLTRLECSDIPLADLCMFSMHTGRGKETTFVPSLRDLTVHCPSLIPEIHQMAKDRSHIYQNALNGRSVSPEFPPDHLFSVKLVFSDHRRCQNVAETLLDTGESHLISARSKLSDTLSELDIQVDEIKEKAKKMEKGKTQLSSIWKSFPGRNPGKTLDGMFSSLEIVPIKNMPEAMLWAIHVLEKFSFLDASAIPQNAKYNFINRANSLVYSWRYILRRQNVSHRWNLYGRFGLFYVASAPGIHDSPGKYKIEEDKDILWGHYDHSDSKPINEYIAWRRKVNFS